MDKNVWTVGEAKQQFSEVLRRSEEEPQLIYRRNRLVAAIIHVDDAGDVPGAPKPPSLGQYVRDHQDVVQKYGFTLPRTKRRSRKNAFAETLNELAARHERPE